MNKSVSVVLLLDNKLSSLRALDHVHYNRSFAESQFDENQNENLVNYLCDLEVELVVGYDKNVKAQVLKHYKSIADKIVEVADISNQADAYNTLFKECEMEYVCVLKQNVFLEPDWLKELIAYSKIVDKAGCVSIVSSYLSCELISLLSSDNESMVSVYLPKEDYFDIFGVMFFQRQYLYLVGGLDTSDDFKLTMFLQWQMRFTRCGFHNFAVPTQSCIYIPKEHCNLDVSDLDKVAESLEWMRKTRSFYIPLS